MCLAIQGCQAISELLDALADAIMDDAIRGTPAVTPGDNWAEWLHALLSTLVGHGVELQRARVLTLAGERFTVGCVLEEQAPADDTQQAPDIDELQRRLPTTVRAIGEYFSAGRTSDDLFQDILRVFLDVPQKS
jgi:TetR/AcrR family tetracycline transcriptional repressor